jgi:hypothetical protein
MFVCAPVTGLKKNVIIRREKNFSVKRKDFGLYGKSGNNFKNNFFDKKKYSK